MWAIGIRKTYDVDVEYVSVKDSILNEKSLVRRFLVVFGLKFLIWEKKYNSNNIILKEDKVGFKS